MNDPKTSLFQPLRGNTLSGRIVDHVRKAIFDKTLCPGDFLGSEAELAKQYDVSRMSIRDALRTLEAMGIIEIRMGAGGGVRIARGNPARFADALAVQLSLIGVTEKHILESQLALECMISELAAQNATEQDILRLKKLLKQAHNHLNDSATFTDLSLEFHLALADAAHNPVISAQLMAMRHVIWPKDSRRARPEIAQKVLDSHMEILDKIEQGSVLGARQSMQEHLCEIIQARDKGQKISDRESGDGVCC